MNVRDTLQFQGCCYLVQLLSPPHSWLCRFLPARREYLHQFYPLLERRLLINPPESSQLERHADQLWLCSRPRLKLCMHCIDSRSSLWSGVPSRYPACILPGLWRAQISPGKAWLNSQCRASRERADSGTPGSKCFISQLLPARQIAAV
jgi:hypothetical protein